MRATSNFFIVPPDEESEVTYNVTVRVRGRLTARHDHKVERQSEMSLVEAEGFSEPTFYLVALYGTARLSGHDKPQSGMRSPRQKIEKQLPRLEYQPLCFQRSKLRLCPNPLRA